MTIVNFTPLPSLIGGLIIGLASVLLLISNGKIAGISGISKGIFNTSNKDKFWRIIFLIGLISGGFLQYNLFSQQDLQINYPPIDMKLVMAAILVGTGTALGNGCTSGHGICGLSRRSKRSFIATCTFMLFGFLTLFLEKFI